MSKNKIFNDDVVEWLKKCETNYDLIIADPPYNQDIAKWDSYSDDDYWEFMNEWIGLAAMTLKEGGAIWIFNNQFNSAKTIPILLKNNLSFVNWITWYKKDGFGAPKSKFRSMQETILFFKKGSKLKTFNFDDVRVDYKSPERIKAAKNKGILKNGKRWFPNEYGALRSDVWEFSSFRHKNKENGKTTKNDHETPKPHDLIEIIVRTHKTENMRVLDLFSGSGSTSIVCQKMGIDSDGVELNEKFFSKIKEKLNV